MVDKKKIARNTVYMYVRMLFVMLVSIYTSRVILDKLGIDDYGLYNAITSVIAVLAFLNQTLSSSTSRFLTYELGTGNINKLGVTFSTLFFTHLALAAIILVAMESGGLWYMLNKFVVSVDRRFIVMIVYQIALLSSLFAICQVPYTAAIIAHEDFDIFAYIGIFDVVAKLLVAYLISISPWDKMLFYATILLLVQITIFIMYVSICLKKYKESYVKFKFDSNLFKKIMGFTGWTSVANFTNTINVQGSILLLNLFFSPAIVAAKALSNQITNAVMQFCNNFSVAIMPQIVKSYASGNKSESNVLTLKSTIISFDLMLIISLPFIFTMKPILNLWLVEVPSQGVAFAQLAIFSQIINVLSSSTYVSFVASGKQKLNALLGAATSLSYFLILYVIFFLGAPALWVQYLYLIMAFWGVLVLRPYLLCKELSYKLSDIWKCYFECFRVLIISVGLSFLISLVLDDSLYQQMLLFFLVFILSIVCSFLFLEKSMRRYIIQFIINKYKSLSS